MDLNTEQKKITLFDGEPDYDYLVEKGLMSKEEAEKQKKYKEIEQKHIETALNGQYELAQKYLDELKNMY